MNIPPIVIKKLESLLPESLKNDMTAFVLLPETSPHADLVICTKHEEVIEIKNRNIVCTLSLNQPNIQINKIFLHRRKDSKYFSYILQSNDSVSIVTKELGDEMILKKKYNDVTNIELDDVALNGKVKVKLWLMDDAIPVVLDDEYSIGRNDGMTDEENEGDELCLVLKQMLAEAKSNAAYNQKKYEEKKAFRHEVMNLMENMQRYDRDGTKEEDVSVSDRLNTGDVWIRTHNNSTVIGVPIANLTPGFIEDVQIILGCEHFKMFQYSTKIYRKINELPYWDEVNKNQLKNHDNLTCLAIFDTPKFEEFTSVVVNTAIQYIWNNKSLCIPLKDTEIKAIDVVSCKFDPLLNKNKPFVSEDILTVILSSIHRELIIDPVDGEEIDFDDFLLHKLNFTKCPNELFNIFTHCITPLNMLHGTLIFYRKEINFDGRNTIKINVFARSESQILLLINLIYDQILKRCVVYYDNLKIKPKNVSPNEEKMETSQDTVFETTINESKLQELGSLLHRQVTQVVNHLEKCMEHMSEENSKMPHKKTSSDSITIDVNALGKDIYQGLWKDLLDKMSVTDQLLQDVLK